MHGDGAFLAGSYMFGLAHWFGHPREDILFRILVLVAYL